jgi:hypothetical protein
MHTLILHLFLLGCPEPLDEEEPMSAEERQKSDAIKRSTNSIPTDINGVQDLSMVAAPPTMGTFPGDMADTELVPRYTQEELKESFGKKGMIHGYVKCDDCGGKILLRALPPPPEPGGDEGDAGMQLVTQKVLTEAGSFSFQVPNNSTVVLQVVDDLDGNGRPSQGERMGMRGSGPLKVEGEVEGIELTVGVFPQKEPQEQLEQPTIPDGAPPSPGTPGAEGASGQNIGQGGPPPDMEGGALGTVTPPPDGGEGGAPGTVTPPPEGGAGGASSGGPPGTVTPPPDGEGGAPSSSGPPADE